RDQILYTCLHNTNYDPQIEGYKTQYLMQIIDLTDDPRFYRDHILKSTKNIQQDTDNRDAQHLVELTTAFAKRGDIEARDIVYQVFESNFEDEDTLGASNIIEIDGVTGFVFLANKLAHRKRQSNETKAYDFLLWLLEEEVGEEQVSQQLALLRDTDEDLDHYLILVENDRKAKKSRRRKIKDLPNLPQTYEDMKQLMARGSGPVEVWGKNATLD